MRGATADGGADQMNLSDAGSAGTPAASIRVDVRPPNYRLSMRYLMLMWAEADAASGDESDLQAWVDFDEQVKANGAFVLNGALAPASTHARLVQTAIAGHALDGAVQRRPYAEGKRQIEAFYIMDLPNMDAALQWANRLPTTATLRSASCCSSEHPRAGEAPSLHPPSSPHRAWTALPDSRLGSI
jgi:hypothetical protein